MINWSDVSVTAMHPFASYVLRTYYKATGWNEDNLYANLTRSSNGTSLFAFSDDFHRLNLSSHSRFHRPKGSSPFDIQVPQPALQDDLFNDSYAISQWIRWIYIYLLRLECDDLSYGAFQRNDRTL